MVNPLATFAVGMALISLYPLIKGGKRIINIRNKKVDTPERREVEAFAGSVPSREYDISPQYIISKIKPIIERGLFDVGDVKDLQNSKYKIEISDLVGQYLHEGYPEKIKGLFQFGGEKILQRVPLSDFLAGNAPTPVSTRSQYTFIDNIYRASSNDYVDFTKIRDERLHTTERFLQIVLTHEGPYNTVQINSEKVYVQHWPEVGPNHTRKFEEELR